MIKYSFMFCLCACVIIASAQRTAQVKNPQLTQAAKPDRQRIPQPDAESEAFYKKAMATIRPEYKTLVVKTAGEMKARTLNVDSLAGVMKQNPQLASLGGGDIEALAFLVMMQASKSGQEDLKAVMSDIKKVNEQKKSLRQGKDNGSIKVDSTHAGVIRDQVEAEKESKSEMREEQQLKMQMMMDRRAKMMEMLSNTMKKMRDTQDQIIQNLK